MEDLISQLTAASQEQQTVVKEYQNVNKALKKEQENFYTRRKLKQHSQRITDPANTLCVDPRRDMSTTKRKKTQTNGKCKCHKL
jgi:hypothetical protein